MQALNNILIVDDDSRNIYALSAVLKSRGYDIFTATSAEDALSIMKEHPVGIVLSDMMMPGTDGYDFVRIIREDSDLHNVPVIAVTAQAMIGDREKCLNAGANEYLSKPVNVDMLLSLLQKYKIGVG